MEVVAWVEKVSIPTYKVGAPEKNPMFLEKRVYQGSSGVVYPHPVIEQIADEKTDVEYTAVFLENEYLKIMILPEIGGRIQRAYDKIRKRDFVYYNQVIKPALVGLAGPWISGGIEFNWPQHHRPSTFEAVDYTIEENADGSKTVWVNETEIMFRTKGMAGFTLYPDKAYLEIKGKLFNRTPFPQTFLWWANPAVKVNEHYQSVFPPDVYAVFDHGKRDVSDFPIATGTYYKVNYAPGTDISRYDTIPVPTSYMAIRSQYDFMGCYEHDTQAGMLHVADHHLSPGKKQWTWGNGDFGFAWDRNLTDEDGPYIELMTGVFTDNQPDFSWLQPNEGKTFEQYFMPYAGIGMVKNATKEAMINVVVSEKETMIKVYVTACYANAKIQVLQNDITIKGKKEDTTIKGKKEDKIVKEYAVNLSPAEIFEVTFSGFADEVIVSDNAGITLVSWQPEKASEKEIPAAATAAKLPAEIEQVEELYLNGLHLEQYRHATFNPIDYYEEGLRRSPKDIRCNNAMGLLHLRRGQFKKSLPYFRTAITTLTSRNPNPYDGEVYYNLGLALFYSSQSAEAESAESDETESAKAEADKTESDKTQSDEYKLDEAYDAFYKATWNDAFQHSAFLMLARIASQKGKFSEALQLIEKSLIRNYHSHTARHLKAILLRKNLERKEKINLEEIEKNNVEGTEMRNLFIQESMSIDSFNYGCLFEQYLINKDKNILNKMNTLMRGAVNNYLELSLDYAHAGLYTEATEILEQCASTNPLVNYYKGWFELKNNQNAVPLFKTAAAQNPNGCFPNKIEEILILESAIQLNKTDAHAHYYLGNFWYDKRQYKEAISNWESAVKLNNTFPTPYRNLSLAYYNKLNEKAKAITFMEKAFALDPTDSRILMELDQLHKITGKGFKERLNLLEAHITLVEERDDLYLERITLYNNLRNFEQAKILLSNRKFHPWEGGEGRVVGQYILCYTQLAKQAIQQKQFEKALELLTAVSTYPDNLGEGKLYGAQENDIHYLLASAYEGLNQKDKAGEYYIAATRGISQPVQAIYYNDPQPDKIVYQALAWQKLGEPEKASEIFHRFILFGEQHMSDKVFIDYFAVSLPDMLVFDMDIDLRNAIHCKYLVGLGHLGLGDTTQGNKYLKEVIASDINHQGAVFNPLIKE